MNAWDVIKKLATVKRPDFYVHRRDAAGSRKYVLDTEGLNFWNMVLSDVPVINKHNIRECKNSNGLVWIWKYIIVFYEPHIRWKHKWLTHKIT